MASGNIVVRIPVKSKDDEKMGILAFVLPGLLKLIGIRTKAKVSFEPDLPEVE